MRSYYPKSFLKLVLIGLLLVVVPTLFVLLSITVAIDQLASRAQTAIQQAARATQASRRLGELVTAMERNARQFAILSDDNMLESYRDNRERLTQTVRELSSLDLGGERARSLAALTEREREIFAVLANPRAEQTAVTAAIEGFDTLDELARSVMSRSNGVIAKEIDALGKAGSDVRGMIFWDMLALVPAVIVLIAGSTFIVARPVRDIEHAIRRMGRGDFDTEIAVGGPEDLRYLGEQLDWLRRRMIDLEQQRNRFLQHVSHELKTPLTALREGSELLAGGVVGKLSEEQREIARILCQHSLHLQRLIEDLLNYGALQSQKLTLNQELVSLNEVIARSVAGQSVALKAKDLQIQTDSPRIRLLGDAEKLWVILDNLLSNAIKFSPRKGNIQVTAQQTNAAVQLDVVDSGPGIPREDRDRVFEPFYRGTTAREGRVNGTGLGLSIVKEYVVAHGGSVAVVNDSHRGGHFRVMLPCDGSAVLEAGR